MPSKPRTKKPVVLLTLLAMLFLCALNPTSGFAQVHALYIKSIPTEYAGQESFIERLQNSGANTLFLDMPLTKSGTLDQATLPNMVFLAHKAGLKIFIVMPVRKIPSLLEAYPEWEDMEYNPRTGAIQQSGKIDLFKKEAVDYIASLAGDAASYSIDGVILNSDFAYGSFEGMSREALAIAGKRIGHAIRPNNLYARVVTKPEGQVIEKFGELFKPWTEVKRDLLLDVLAAIRKSINAAQKSAVLGVAVPIMYPVYNQSDMMTRYAMDMNAIRKQNVEYFWSMIPDGIDGGQRTESYRQFLEVVSRAGQSLISSVKEREKVIVIMPIAAPGGKMLPLSEIEEATGLLRKAGGLSIGYTCTPDHILLDVFSKKMFR